MSGTSEWSDGFLEGWGIAISAAISIARKEGVSPEMNVSDGGPDWYKHAQRIADKIQKLNAPVKETSE